MAWTFNYRDAPSTEKEWEAAANRLIDGKPAYKDGKHNRVHDSIFVAEYLLEAMAVISAAKKFIASRKEFTGQVFFGEPLLRALDESLSDTAYL